MKKITLTEFKKLTSRPVEKIGVLSLVSSLAVGTGMVVKNNEWHYKTDLPTACSQAGCVLRRTGNPTFRTQTKRLYDKSGYAILRLS